MYVSRLFRRVITPTQVAETHDADLGFSQRAREGHALRPVSVVQRAAELVALRCDDVVGLWDRIPYQRMGTMISQADREGDRRPGRTRMAIPLDRSLARFDGVGHGRPDRIEAAAGDFSGQ